MILSEIWIYPVKSCKGFNQTEAQVQRRGLLNDRRCIFLDENDTFLSQRTLPSLATLRTSIENGRLKFEYEGQMIWVDNNLHQQPKTITVWDKSCEGYAMGKEIDEVLSNWLGKKIKLYYQPDKAHRKPNPDFSLPQDELSFADGYPILLCTDASLNDLNQRLTTPVPMNRFRPNLVISGVERAFAEDTWRRIKIGEVLFNVAKPCERCVMTTVEQEKGVSSGKEPLKTLATFRLFEGYNSPIFGQNLIPEREGVIRVGDRIEILT